MVRRQVTSHKLFKPRSRKPEKIIAELLAEANRLVKVTEKVHKRHEVALKSDGYFARDCIENVERSIVATVFENAEPDEFDFDFHELRRSYLDSSLAIDAELRMNYFLAANRYAGLTLILKSIWETERWLGLAYRVPSSPQEQPEFDPASFAFAFKSAAVLKMYIALEAQQGIDSVLLVLTGQFSTL